MTRLNRNAILGILIVIGLIASLGFLAIRPTRADKPGAAQPEVIPTIQQQQPIKDLLLEKQALAKQKDDEISGAIKMLMSQLTDPVTGKLGLDAKWIAVSDGKDGFRFKLQESPAGEPEKKPTQ